jgi:hypothetical protein
MLYHHAQVHKDQHESYLCLLPVCVYATSLRALHAVSCKGLYCAGADRACLGVFVQHSTLEDDDCLKLLLDLALSSSGLFEINSMTKC